MKLLKPLLGRLTQGVIFSCAVAENYEAYPVHGLVVTARCDVEQQKAPLLSYLPVIDLDAWMAVDGYDLLLGRATAEAEARFAALLDSVDLSRSLLLTQAPRAIFEVIFEPTQAERKYAKARDRALGLVERLEQLSRLLSDRSPVELFESSDGQPSALIRELATQRLTGFYFLPTIEEGGRETGYVVLLRQLNYLPRLLAKAVATGLDKGDRILQESRWSGSLSFDHETFAMPLGELPSPNIEHVLQSFSFLYGRIGIEDLPPAYLETLTRRLPTGAIE